MQNKIVHFVGKFLKSIFQHIRDLLEIRMAAKVVTDHFSIKQINNRRQVELLFIDLEFSDVCNPFAVWHICFEVPFQQVWSYFANLTFPSSK